MSKSSVSRLTASQRRAALAALTDEQLLARIRAAIAGYRMPSEKENLRLLYAVAVSRKKEGR